MTRDLLHLTDIIDLFEVRERLARGETLDDSEHEQIVSVREELERRIAARVARGDLAASLLSSRLGLSATEMEVLWRLVAVSASSRPRPSLEQIKIWVYGAGPSLLALDELSRKGKLRALRLIERVDRGEVGTHEGGCWTISERVQEWLYGRETLDESVAALRGRRMEPRAELVATPVAPSCRRFAPGKAYLLVGKASSGRRSFLLDAARRDEIDVIQIDPSRLAVDETTMHREVSAIARECLLLEKVPLLIDLDKVGGPSGHAAAIIQILGRLFAGPILATCVDRPKVDWGRPLITQEMGASTAKERSSLWRSSLGCGTEKDGRNLASMYPLAPGLIVRAAEVAKAQAIDRPMMPEDIRVGLRTVLDDRLGDFARRVTVTQSWDDVVLPQDQVNAIVELMARARGRDRVYEEWGFATKVGRGLGVTVLFSGPPGTGKTMIAGLIAKDLGIDLYQVDMSKVVSKFIGETEKNLAALFDAAEAGHALLLFDEADALFGKRTDVKSSNDRYANLETNYLLQRLESFTGICLLTSNHENHIDPAFQRRLSLHVRFELPDPDERAKLWCATLPAAAPCAPGIDFASLGRRFEMSGGYIRNAALRAAFLAADAGTAITAAHLEYAARVEYEGMGKIAA